MIAKKEILLENLSEFEDKSRILLQGNEYIDLLPHTDLRDFISYYTVTFPIDENEPDYYTIVPQTGGMIFVKSKQTGMSATLYGTLQSRSNVDNITGLLVIVIFEPLGVIS